MTPDTSISHLASLYGIPTITIFTATNGNIWRNSIQTLDNILQSRKPLDCTSMKSDGTCTQFYTDCCCADGSDLSVEELRHKIRMLLNS